MENKFFKECELCEANANILCFDCNDYFCDSCYKSIHNNSKYQNHKKEKMNPFISIDLKCPYHPKDRINLFCLNERGNNLFIIIIFYFK